MKEKEEAIRLLNIFGDLAKIVIEEKIKENEGFIYNLHKLYFEKRINYLKQIKEIIENENISRL